MRQSTLQDDVQLLSIADWAVVMLGGALGGQVGLILLAAFLSRQSVLTTDAFGVFLCCGGVGISTGILPGLAALDMMTGKKGRRWIGFLLAFASGAWFTGGLAAMAVAGASCQRPAGWRPGASSTAPSACSCIWGS